MALTASFTGFVVAALVVLLIPGPGVMYVVTRSISQGRRAGLVSVLGLSAGALVHVAAAAAGLSVILATSAAAFAVVKTIGALYLIYLGIRTLFGREPSYAVTKAPRRSVRRLFTDGVIVSVFNPKIAIFFLAFLPQFVPKGSPSIPLQVLALGLIYVGLALITDGSYAILASTLRSWIGERPLQARLSKYASAALYLGLGAGAALTDRRP